MTDRPETKFRPRPASGAALLIYAAVLIGAGPAQAGGRDGVGEAAPRMTQVDFSTGPLDDAAEFAPWRALAAQTAEDQPRLEACLSDKQACATPELIRMRRMIELARGLEGRDQISLVHHYFNATRWTSDARDTWSTMYHTAMLGQGDCEDIALAKYQALRLLGWAPERLRVLVGWDGEERDWHAWLAVRDADGGVLVLDSVNGLQRPVDFRHARIVYSISDQGVWDHAPDYVPRGGDGTDMASERAARIAASQRLHHKGVLR